MTIEDLVRYLKYAFNIMVVTNLLVWLMAWQKRKFIESSPVIWLMKMIGYLSILAVTEWGLLEFILRKSFAYFGKISPILKALEIQDTSFIGSFSYFLKFIFLSLFFRDLFQDPLKKRFFQYLMYALVVFELVQVFVFKSYQGYDSLSSTVKNVFILGGTGLFMYKLYRADSHGISLYKNPYFWLTLGLMLPALAEIFLEFIFTKLYQTDLLGFYKLYLVRNASQIVGFTLLIVGVWQAKYLRFLPKEY
jgi:hypothetical protein